MDELNISGASNQLRYFLDTLVSPTGLVGLGLVIGLTIFALVTRNGRWAVLSVMLFATSMMVFVDKSLQLNAAPSGGLLGGVRGTGRAMATALLVALVPVAITSDRGWRTSLLTGAAFWFFAFQLTCSVRYALDEQWSRAIVGTAVFALIFFVLGVGVPKWLQTFEDVDRLVGTLAGAGFLLVGLSTLELLANPGAVLIRNRFMGTTGNPQHVAAMLALIIPATAYLLTRGTAGRLWGNVYRVALGMQLLFLAWTGSRTGLLMTTVAMAYMFRKRLGKFAGAMVAGAVVMFVGMQLFSTNPDGTARISFDRLVSTEDTRSVVWSNAVDRFMESPVLGYSSDNTDFVENSYLAALTRFGIVGVIPLFIAIVLIFRNGFKLWATPNMPPEFTHLADLTMAGMFAILIGSFFEAYLLANIGFPIAVLWILLAIQAFLRNAAPLLGPDSFDAIATPYEQERQAELGHV